MRKQVRLKRQGFYPKARDIVALIVLGIILMAVFIFMKFNQAITPRLLSVANMRLNNVVSNIVHKSFTKEVLKPELISNIMIINLDNNDQIVSVDFNLENVYELARLISEEFSKNFYYLETGQLDKLKTMDTDYLKEGDGYIMNLPIGIGSSSIYLANLGPKIPVRVKFLGTVLTKVRTKVSDYGINNALIEVYLDMDIERQIIMPVVYETKKLSYEMLISSKIIYGKVPEFYAGMYEKSSNLNIPITE